MTASEVLSKKETCPQCGAVVGTEQSVARPASVSDTQMVNIGDMARMAQEGLDVTASGEWDTTMLIHIDEEDLERE